MSEQHENVKTVNEIAPAILSGDHGTLARIFTDDVAFHLRGPVPFAGDYEGAGGVLEGIGALVASVDDVDLEQQFCAGWDEWAAEWEHCTLKRNGKTLESRNAFVYRFDGDRIDEMWMFLGAQPELAEVFLA
jgi:ketosteroid isomerase-like protein